MHGKKGRAIGNLATIGRPRHGWGLQPRCRSPGIQPHRTVPAGFLDVRRLATSLDDRLDLGVILNLADVLVIGVKLRLEALLAALVLERSPMRLDCLIARLLVGEGAGLRRR